MIFDLLHTGAGPLLGQPYLERRTPLNQLNPTGPAWQTPPSWIGGGADILAATAEQGLEGIIAKRTASTYQPGRRSPSWRKIKNIQTVDVLIGGWSAGGGRGTGTIGSLLVGVSTRDGLAYIGNVRHRFHRRGAPRSSGQLTALEVPASPFDAVPCHPSSPAPPGGSDPSSAAKSPTRRLAW